MTDTTVADATANADVHSSQIIDNAGADPSAQGRGVHLPETEAKDEPKQLSTRDAIAKAFDEANKSKDEAKPETKTEAEKPVDKTAKVEDKPATEEKPQRARADDGKFSKTENAEPASQVEQKGAPDEAATGQEGSERRPSEGRQPVEPPARFLPKEREQWANVPHVVKSAVERLAKEHEAEISQYRESHENWQKLSKFDEMAKQHKTSVSDALERYTALDGLLSSNPIEGIRQILATRGITPEQYANHVLSNPDAHRAPSPQAQPDPAIQQFSSKVEQLEATIESMRHEQAAASIIEPFRAANPRYDELQDDIALFLQSGKIPASLSPIERLEAAYDMAERINPLSVSALQEPKLDTVAAKPDHSADAADGRKSIRGAPTSGQTGEPKWVPKSNREALERAFAQSGRR